MTGVDGIGDELADALAYVGIINRADLRAEFERDDGARLLKVPGIGKARLSALREWAQGE
ncbi:MAG: helix-hairpin-helix domain-containing protein [Anaerolineales bacterium]|nr:helix-hairpin-helix domain-containing protein [Anaerolineales bacterium]